MGLPPEMMMVVVRYLMVSDISAVGKLRCTCRSMRDLGKVFFLKSELPKSRISGKWLGLYPQQVSDNTPLLLLYESAFPKVGFYLPVSIANIPQSQRFEADFGSQNGNGNGDGQEDGIGLFDVRPKFGNFVGVVAKILSDGMPDVFKFIKSPSHTRSIPNILPLGAVAAPPPPPLDLQQQQQQHQQQQVDDNLEDMYQ